MLLLSWAVHSQQVEQFIADIRSLSSEDQHSLMLLINSTMKQFGDGALVAGTFHVGLVCKYMYISSLGVWVWVVWVWVVWVCLLL